MIHSLLLFLHLITNSSIFLHQDPPTTPLTKPLDNSNTIIEFRGIFRESIFRNFQNKRKTEENMAMTSCLRLEGEIMDIIVFDG